jgi:hypothetical protein
MAGEPNTYSDGDVDEIIADLFKRIAELEAALRSVRKEIVKDHSMGFPSERAAQSLMLADIDRVLAVK